MTNAYYKPDPENDKLLQAITACLQEDGHHTQLHGKGNSAAITITHKNHKDTYTLTSQNGQIHIHPNNIQFLDFLLAEANLHILELADPELFTKITKHINNNSQQCQDSKTESKV